MVRVRSKADLITFMEWEGEVPDDVPENERWYWIKQNIDGGQFYEPDQRDGDWVWGTDVELIEDED
jgi:hypothetical protein